MTEESSHSIIDEFKVGCRIEHQSQFGTVKYIGEVDEHPSVWLGINWDDATRGKHDGSVNGKRYFIASSPTSGSFVRPGKIKPGVNAITAITTRYGKRTDSNDSMIQKELMNLQREMNAPFISMVGFDKVNEKQSNFRDLRVVSLRMQRVKDPAPDGQILEICPNITELDLSKNLFCNWNEIFIICKQLKYLYWLNLSENLLEFSENISEFQFPSVTTLICGNMNLNWNDVLTITKIFPNTTELRLPFNKINNINLPENHCLNSVNILDLEGNVLNDWSEVHNLGFLLYLEQLIITNIALSKIMFQRTCEEDGKVTVFKNLKQLVISDNIIDNWESISELNKLHCLEDLRFLKNPILETENPATCFQLIIARISTLNILNGTVIKMEDRKGAEYDYIKKQGLEWLRIKDDDAQKREFLQRHPRYIELINKYGEPEESELISRAPSLQTSLTSVEIHCGERVISKKLPSTMMLQKLIMLVQKLFNLPERPMLCYTSSEHPEMEIEMDDEFKEIGFYSLQSGDKIFVK